MSPFSINNFFLAHVKTAFTGSMYNRSSAVPLLYVLSKTMIRHTKLQVSSLPARAGPSGVFCQAALKVTSCRTGSLALCTQESL